VYYSLTKETTSAICLELKLMNTYEFGSVGNASDFLVWVVRGYNLGHDTDYPEVSVDFLSSSRQMPGQY
jgi:hypothetical protein